MPIPPRGRGCLFSRKICLGFEWNRRGSLLEAVTVSQRPVLSIEYPTLQPIETIRRDAQAIESLVSLCIDVPVAMDKLVFRRPDIRVRMLSGDESSSQQPIELRVPFSRTRGPMPAGSGTDRKCFSHLIRSVRCRELGVGSTHMASSSETLTH